MQKSKAFELLGGTPTTVAEAVGISPSAVSQWPEILPPRIADRVLAAMARKHLPAALIGVTEDAPLAQASPVDQETSRAAA